MTIDLRKPAGEMLTPSVGSIFKQVERKLVWVLNTDGWTQIPMEVAKKERIPHLDLESEYVPSASYAIELLNRMEPSERDIVLSYFKQRVE